MFDFKVSFWISSFLWLLLGLCHVDSWAQQVVFIDFDSATSEEDHVYTPSERQQILAEVEKDFAGFQFFFTDVEPTSGEFSTVTVNDVGGGLFAAFPGWSAGDTDPADGTDFRNLNRGDNGTVDLNSFASTSEEFVTQTANVVSRIVGELSGLRNLDALGPIGSGVLGASEFSLAGSIDDFVPAYPGPVAAFETQFHLLENSLPHVPNNADLFFSERSAIKLTFNEIGTSISEAAGDKGTLATAQDIVLAKMTVPNTIEVGDRANLGDFDVDALAISGSVDVGGQSDFYRFEANAGSILNIQFLRLGPFLAQFVGFDAQVTLLDESGNPVDYFGVPANNDEGFVFNPFLIDLVIPEDGVYFIHISATSVPKGRRVRENPDLTPEEIFQLVLQDFLDSGNPFNLPTPVRSDLTDLFPEFATGTYELFVSQFNGEVASDSVGDFDNDGDVDIDDVDFYVGNIGSPATGLLAQLDMNTDGQITSADLDAHLTNLVQTSNGQTGALLGDLNLDGSVNVLGDAFILIQTWAPPFRVML